MAIFCLVGKSGSGKDTIRKKLLESTDLRPLVVSTTRPIRDGEVDGVDYRFRKGSEVAEDLATGQVVVFESYRTLKGDWDYYIMLDEFTDYNKGNYITGGSALFADILMDKAMELGIDVKLIYLEVDEVTRMNRLVQRECASLNRDFPEMCRRYLSDEKYSGYYKDFRYDLVVCNHQLDQCLNSVLNFLSENSVGLWIQKRVDFAEKFFGME